MTMAVVVMMLLSCALLTLTESLLTHRHCPHLPHQSPRGMHHRSVSAAAAATGSGDVKETLAGGTERTWRPSPDSSAEDTALARSLSIWPLDSNNCNLLNEVRHRDYENPTPAEVYDLVVIGAGAGGLVSSRQAARRGARSCMISAELAGGDCLNAGCVPSKALLRCAKLVREAKKVATSDNDYGVYMGLKGLGRDEKGAGKGEAEIVVDFPKIMERMRRLRAQIAPVDGHNRGSFLGTQTFQGFGVFVSPCCVEVVEHGRALGDASNPRLNFRKAVIATGGRPHVPGAIPGLMDAPFTTNMNLFNLQRLPQRTVVLGAGVVALEMAQCLAAFGSKVTVLQRSRLLSGGDDDAARVLKMSLEEESVSFFSKTKVRGVETLYRPLEEDELPLMRVSLTCEEEGDIDLECECLLLALGRSTNVQGMGLESAGVRYDEFRGVLVNDLAQSISNPNVYGVGDCVANVPRLTHMSGEMAKIVVQNSLFGDKWKLSSLVVPAVMYTDPEYAVVRRVITLDDNGYVGATPKKDTAQYDEYKVELKHNDRAILDGTDEDGFVKVLCKRGTETIVGCTIVSSRAGEMVNEVSLAIKHGIGLKGLARNIHSYPSLGEAVMGCGLQYLNSRWEMFDA